MKNIYFLMAVVVSLTGCAASKNLPSENQTGAVAAGGASNNGEPSISAPNPVASAASQATPPNPVAQPSYVAPTLQWSQFEVLAILLDNNKKPIKSQNYPMTSLSDVTPYDKNSLKLSVVNFDTNQGTGKVLQLSCGSLHIKQKFDTPYLLKGWTTEFNCNKTNYLILINPVNTQ